MVEFRQRIFYCLFLIISEGHCSLSLLPFTLTFEIFSSLCWPFKKLLLILHMVLHAAPGAQPLRMRLQQAASPKGTAEARAVSAAASGLCRCWPQGWVERRPLYMGKRLSGACSWLLETSQLSDDVLNMATIDAHGMFYLHPPSVVGRTVGWRVPPVLVWFSMA